MRDQLAFLPESREAVGQSGNTLLKWLEEFQSKESHLACGILSKDFGGDGWGFAGDDSRGSGGRGRNGEIDDLTRAEDVGRGYTSSRGADVERFCELDEFGPGGVCRTQKDRHLQPNA